MPQQYGYDFGLTARLKEKLKVRKEANKKKIEDAVDKQREVGLRLRVLNLIREYNYMSKALPVASSGGVPFSAKELVDKDVEQLLEMHHGLVIDQLSELAASAIQRFFRASLQRRAYKEFVARVVYI